MKGRAELDRLDRLIADEASSLGELTVLPQRPKFRVNLAPFVQEYEDKQNQDPNCRELPSDLQLRRLGLAVRRKELDSSLAGLLQELQEEMGKLEQDLN